MMHTYTISRILGATPALELACGLACGENMSVEISPDILLKDKSKIVIIDPSN
jgi:hypothetical protein